MTEETPRFQLTEQQVFDRLVTLYENAMTVAEDISALKGDVKYNKKKNPNGIPTQRLGEISAAAKLEAATNFEEFSAKAAGVKAAYEEFTNYND